MPDFVYVNGKVRRAADLEPLPPAAAALAGIAQRQRRLAVDLRAQVQVCLDAGLTWMEIGALLSMPRETAFRQFKSGRPMWVGRGAYGARAVINDD
jgi:hypothetical protein